MPYYHLYELTHAALSPARAATDVMKLYMRNPLNPLSHTQAGRSTVAMLDLFERVTRRYGKPEFGIETVGVSGHKVPVREKVVWERPFCRLIHFEKSSPRANGAEPKLLIVAPMSGHYATLLRGTVEDMLPNHDVYITDWVDARMVPVSEGTFDLDDYIDYIINIQHVLGGDLHVMAVCQPSVPVLAAVALMSERNDPYVPRTMTLMGGPIDTRENPTAVNKLAEERGMDWFRRNVIVKVPFPHPGFMRDVYPGFLQLSGFMGMNLDRHLAAHRDYFMHLVEGDGDSAEAHKEFYDEYLAVMDLTAEFYLQTVETVFIDHSLPKGAMMHRGMRVDPSKITKTALLTVEGERDDISGIGQTEAAHKLCSSLPDSMRDHYVQPRVGHYGVFNGSRFRAEIAPRIGDFILSHDPTARSLRDTRKSPAAKAARAAVATAKKALTGGRIKGNGAVTNGSAPISVTPPASGAPAKANPRKATNGLLKSPNGSPDDLKLISGVGPKLEKELNGLGIYHYWQIAEWKKADISAVDEKLRFKGRIERDDWIGQARKLSKST